MRLTCPNCGAQYEVPEEVIPTEGRDVQCSNCGDTWFQPHASQIQTEEPAQPPAPPTPAPSDDEIRAALHGTSQPEPTAPKPEDEPPAPAAPVQNQLDPSFKDILREEAALEAQLRAGEAGNTLESQPDLGLDDMPADESERRAREARERMARIRGNDGEPKAESGSKSVEEHSSRRGLLPDIEEINSTLRSDGDSGAERIVASPVSVSRRKNKGGFTRGFAVVVLIATAMIMIYVRAPQIAQSFPSVDPALNSYVAAVDRSRLWLDSKIGDLIPKPSE